MNGPLRAACLQHKEQALMRGLRVAQKRSQKSTTHVGHEELHARGGEHLVQEARPAADEQVAVLQHIHVQEPAQQWVGRQVGGQRVQGWVGRCVEDWSLERVHTQKGGVHKHACRPSCPCLLVDVGGRCDLRLISFPTLPILALY